MLTLRSHPKLLERTASITSNLQHATGVPVQGRKRKFSFASETVPLCSPRWPGTHCSSTLLFTHFLPRLPKCPDGRAASPHLSFQSSDPDAFSEPAPAFYQVQISGTSNSHVFTVSGFDLAARFI